jgi:ABC-type multidrug transport system fused ATPase/permease subunit
MRRQLILVHSTVYKPTNKSWHRLNLMKGFALEDSLRRDITVTGIAPWLTAEIADADNELGDTSTRSPWQRRALSLHSFAFHVVSEVIESLEYIWVTIRGVKSGTSLGSLHLIRDTGRDFVQMVWELSYTAEESTGDWKNLIAYYKCLEMKSEMETVDRSAVYVSQPGGMKIEARAIRYKYDTKKGTDVLTGASFVINPGEMVAVVGYSSPFQ